MQINPRSSKIIPHHRFKAREKGLQTLVEISMKHLLDADFVGTEMTKILEKHGIKVHLPDASYPLHTRKSIII